MDQLLTWVLDVSLLIQELLPITGPPLIKERGFDLAANRVGMVNPNMIQNVVAGINLMGG